MISLPTIEEFIVDQHSVDAPDALAYARSNATTQSAALVLLAAEMKRLAHAHINDSDFFSCPIGHEPADVLYRSVDWSQVAAMVWEQFEAAYKDRYVQDVGLDAALLAALPSVEAFAASALAHQIPPDTARDRVRWVMRRAGRYQRRVQVKAEKLISARA